MSCAVPPLAAWTYSHFRTLSHYLFSTHRMFSIELLELESSNCAHLGVLIVTTQQLTSLSIPTTLFALLLLLILITSQAECRELNAEGGCALPVQSAVPALFSLYHISRTRRIYMDFPPPSLLCLLWEVFSLRLFFPATVLTLSLANDASGLSASQQNLINLFQGHMCSEFRETHHIWILQSHKYLPWA